MQQAFGELLNTLEDCFHFDPGASPSHQNTVSLQKKVESLNVESSWRQRFHQELFGFGPLESSKLVNSCDEILIQEDGQIWVETQNKRQLLDSQFLSSWSHQQIIRRILEEAQIRLDYEYPQADGRWRHFRVHAIAPPLTPRGIVLSLRQRRKKSWSLHDLSLCGWGSPEIINWLQNQILNGHHFLVFGPTSSGKTSVIEALLSVLKDKTERIILIEDTDELRLPNPLSNKLLTRNPQCSAFTAYSQTDLIKESLRMNPDRLIVGEIRGGEAKDWLLALSTGHRGGITSLHANSIRQALSRLEILINMGAPAWSPAVVRRLIYEGLEYLIHVNQDLDGQRRLKNIYKIAGCEPNNLLFETIF